MAKNKTATTYKQLVALRKLRRLTGEVGYEIFDLPLPHRRTPSDFIAVRKTTGSLGERVRFVVARATAGGKVSILSWGVRGQYADLREAVSYTEAYSQLKILWTKRQAAHGKTDDSWQKYFSTEARESLQAQGVVF